MESLEKALQERFASKKADVVQANVEAARAGYEFARQNWKQFGLGLELSNKQRLVMTGNQGIALGALAANCKFYSAYPMTPASSILHFLAPNGPRNGMLVKQCEDEIAAMNMAVGAGQTGARAMTGTSGGGFSLMTEAVGLAGMLETPVVVVNVQRGGPSTGLPTKTEQGDLNQVFGASQGDFPRIIIAPTNLVDCYNSVIEAHNLAEIYQCPVLIISDLLLSESHESAYLDEFVHNPVIDRGQLLSEWKGPGRYKRFMFTESGISPRALPGTEGAVYVAGTDEHDEDGVLISDVFTNPVIRKKMMEKRMRKIQDLAKTFPLPKLVGPEDAEITLIGWGSSEGVIHEAVNLLNKEGVRVNSLIFKYLDLI